MKRRFVTLGIAGVMLGIAVLLYRGPGRAFVRGHLGDVGATMVVFAALGLTRWRMRTRVVATLALATSIELGQLVWSALGKTGVGALVLGSVFDPWDLVAYAVGAAVGVWWERTAGAIDQSL